MLTDTKTFNTLDKRYPKSQSIAKDKTSTKEINWKKDELANFLVT
jgi:hypothetical protein